MASRDELLAERLETIDLITDVNIRIKAILSRNNKKYEYSNNETKHSAETHTLNELRDMRKELRHDLILIDNKLNSAGAFVQIKNC